MSTFPVCSVITYKYITEHTGIYCYVRSSVIVNCRWIKSRYTIEKHMLSIASVMLMFDCISDESFSIVEPMWMKSPRFSHVFFLFRGQRKLILFSNYSEINKTCRVSCNFISLLKNTIVRNWTQITFYLLSSAINLTFRHTNRQIMSNSNELRVIKNSLSS